MSIKALKILLGIVFIYTSNALEAQTFVKKELKTERDGFQWYEHKFKTSDGFVFAGYSKSGKRLTPNSLRVFYYTFTDEKYQLPQVFRCWEKKNYIGYDKDNKPHYDVVMSIYDIEGNCIVPATKEFNSILYDPDDPDNLSLIHCEKYKYQGGSIESYDYTTYSRDGRYYAEGTFHDMRDFDAKKKPVLDAYVSTTNTTTKITTSSATSGSVETILLYKGEYTLCLSQSRELNSGYSVGEYSSDETETISIYEDHIKINNVTCNYESTNSNGERVYKGSSLGTVTVYVSPTYEIKYYNESFLNGRGMRVTFPVVKGRSYMSNDNGGGNNAGTYTSPTQPSQPKIEKEQRQLKKPHTTYKTCYMCHGDGVCSSCNGKGWFYNSYGTGTVTCPNCSDGKCKTCNGTGKVLGPTEWY